MPGEILSELPEITPPVRYWPKFLGKSYAREFPKNFARPTRTPSATADASLNNAFVV